MSPQLTTPVSAGVQQGTPFGSKSAAAESFQKVRKTSERICGPLATEDYVIQTMDDVSPPKWHLAHTTWFFESFLLIPSHRGYREFHPQYNYLFNSYYEAVGERHPRPERGLLSRPTVEETYHYRRHVDQFMLDLIDRADEQRWLQIEPLLTLGLHHEQQHQELLLTDIKHILGTNPVRPAYETPREHPPCARFPAAWVAYPSGIAEIGFGDSGFRYDNEEPRHQVHLEEYELTNTLVTNGEYLEFIEAGGYEQPRYWLSDGWATAQEERWNAPLYWERIDDRWWVMTLSGLKRLEENEPVSHVSYFEADAYARWRDLRLPTEAEWEIAAAHRAVEGNLFGSGELHPRPAAPGGDEPAQLFGDVWEWTQSPYTAYPGFRPAPGAVGEYNGKFMCNQFVLRGGSCATSANHIRATYRNFFPPQARWQFTGLRLAR